MCAQTGRCTSRFVSPVKHSYSQVTWEWACPAWLLHVSLALPGKIWANTLKKKKPGGHTCLNGVLRFHPAGSSRLQGQEWRSLKLTPGTKRCIWVTPLNILLLCSNDLELSDCFITQQWSQRGKLSYFSCTVPVLNSHARVPWWLKSSLNIYSITAFDGSTVQTLDQYKYTQGKVGWTWEQAWSSH